MNMRNIIIRYISTSPPITTPIFNTSSSFSPSLLPSSPPQLRGIVMFVSNLWTTLLLMFFLGLGLVKAFTLIYGRANLKSAARRHEFVFVVFCFVVVVKTRSIIGLMIILIFFCFFFPSLSPPGEIAYNSLSKSDSKKTK